MLFFINEESYFKANRLLNETGVNGSYICVQPEALNAQETPKRWEEEKFVELLDMLNQNVGLPIIALGDKNEFSLIELIKGRMKSQLHNLAGKTIVKECAAIIKKSSLLLCHDSGLMHMAVALDVPVVAIYEPTDYYRTAHPLEKKYTVLLNRLECVPCMYGFKNERVALRCSHHFCIRGIKVEDVYAAVVEALKINVDEKQ